MAHKAKPAGVTASFVDGELMVFLKMPLSGGEARLVRLVVSVDRDDGLDSLAAGGNPAGKYMRVSGEFLPNGRCLGDVGQMVDVDLHQAGVLAQVGCFAAAVARGSGNHEGRKFLLGTVIIGAFEAAETVDGFTPLAVFNLVEDFEEGAVAALSLDGGEVAALNGVEFHGASFAVAPGSDPPTLLHR